MSAEMRYDEEPIRHRHAPCCDPSALRIAVQLLRGRQGFLDRFEGLCEGLPLAELTLVGMRMLRAETTVAERSAAGRSPVVSRQPIKRTFLPPRTLVRASNCSAVTIGWL